MLFLDLSLKQRRNYSLVLARQWKELIAHRWSGAAVLQSSKCSHTPAALCIFQAQFPCWRDLEHRLQATGGDLECPPNKQAHINVNRHCHHTNKIYMLGRFQTQDDYLLQEEQPPVRSNDNKPTYQNVVVPQSILQMQASELQKHSSQEWTCFLRTIQASEPTTNPCVYQYNKQVMHVAWNAVEYI